MFFCSSCLVSVVLMLWVCLVMMVCMGVEEDVVMVVNW